MRQYSYSMEKVLEWRVSEEDVAMENFAVVLNKLKHEELILKELLIENENIKKESLVKKNIRELISHNLYKQRIDEKIDRQEALISGTRRELEVLRLELVEAQQDRKVMEKLKEKDFASYKDNEMLKQQKELDDMAVIRHSQGSVSEL